MPLPRSDAEYTIWGKVVASPESWPCVNLVSPESPMACPNTKGALENELTNILLGLLHDQVSN
jgi:hypothetical protein